MGLSRQVANAPRPDPRVGLCLAVAFAVLLLLTQSPLALAVEFAAVVLLVARLGLVRAWAGVLRALIPMALFFLIVMLYASDPEAAVGGLLRLAGMTTAFFIFFRTTAPEDLANALVKA